MQKKTRVVMILLCGVFSLLLLSSVRFSALLWPQEPTGIDPEPGLSYLAALDGENVREKEASIRRKRAEKDTAGAVPTDADASRTSAAARSSADDASAAASAAASAETGTTAAPKQPLPPLPAPEGGDFRRAFRDVLISGDSLVKAISEYDVLDASQVIAEIGAGVGYLQDTTGQIVEDNPRYLVLHYGENEMDVPENADWFIGRYRSAIRSLQEQLPDTEIFVDSIFPVEDFACTDEPYLKYIAQYNEKLRQMAGELGVTFLDFTPLWNAFEKDYYDGDGIHPVRSFYTEQYLPYLLKEVVGR